ncbi:unnamed protein product [Phytophthora lilii]|uniref:Unnamed protein product n=1 Tax=Phytophthora lilii TaxID=2077276 RepID=A0A9W6UB08_9STRA|nr:unnamed protein product [Phytophthora lilii]
MSLMRATSNYYGASIASVAISTKSYDWWIRPSLAFYWLLAFPKFDNGPMDTKLPDEPSTAFAVPRRIFAGRKRRAEDTDHSSFFTADDFAAFSVRGVAHESRLYGPLETRRQTLVTPTVATSRKSSAAMKIKKQTKNLVQLLVEAIEAKRIRAPEKMLELDNARRRVSGLSVAEHERYLMLQRKIFQAQQVQYI